MISPLIFSGMEMLEVRRQIRSILKSNSVMTELLRASPDADLTPRLGHQRLPALVRVHIEGIRERPLRFFRAEPDNVLDFQQVLFAVDEKDDDPFEVEDPLHFLDELVEDLSPWMGRFRSPLILLMDARRSFDLHFRLVFSSRSRHALF